MPNHLSIPFKKTYTIPLKEAVRDYLDSRVDSHPEEFKWDIERWETLRKAGVGEVVHNDSIKPALRSVASLLSWSGH